MKWFHEISNKTSGAMNGLFKLTSMSCITPRWSFELGTT